MLNFLAITRTHTKVWWWARGAKKRIKMSINPKSFFYIPPYPLPSSSSSQTTSTPPPSSSPAHVSQGVVLFFNRSIRLSVANSCSVRSITVIDFWRQMLHTMRHNTENNNNTTLSINTRPYWHTIFRSADVYFMRWHIGLADDVDGMVASRARSFSRVRWNANVLFVK